MKLQPVDSTFLERRGTAVVGKTMRTAELTLPLTDVVVSDAVVSGVVLCGRILLPALPDRCIAL